MSVVDQLLGLESQCLACGWIVVGRGDEGALADCDHAGVRCTEAVGLGRCAPEERIPPLVFAEKDVRRSEQEQRGRPQQAVGGKPREPGLRVREHLVDAVAAERRTQHRNPGPKRGAPVQKRSFERPPLGGVEPALRVGRPPSDRVDPPALEGDTGIALEQTLVFEVRQPSFDRGDATSVVRWQRDLRDDRRHAVEIAGGPTWKFAVETAAPQRVVEWESSDGEKASRVASERSTYSPVPVADAAACRDA